MSDELIDSLTRPIIGIENRTPLEVFDIMCYRIGTAALTRPTAASAREVERVAIAMCQNALGSKQCPCAEKGVFNCADAYPGYQAVVAIAALRGQEGR